MINIYCTWNEYSQKDNTFMPLKNVRVNVKQNGRGVGVGGGGVFANESHLFD